MIKINNIAKNTSYLTLALILQKVLSFTYFTILARNLGPENLGKYFFAIAFTSIFSIFIDLGIANVATREVAKKPERAKFFLGNVMMIKLPLAIITLFLTVILINALGYPELVRQLVYISAISMILDSFTTTFFAVVRGFHNLKYESISSVAFQFIAMSFGLYFLYTGKSLLWIISALAIASAFNFIFSVLVLYLKLRIKILPIFDKEFILKIIKLTIPFGLFAIFQRFYMFLDSVLLSILAGDKYVGYYQIAFKIIFALQFLPLAFNASLYPAFSSYWKNNRAQLVVSFERALNYLIIIALPISAGILVLADKIMLLFNSGYDEAILPLQIIMLSLVFVFINFPIGSLLNACDKQNINTRNMGIVVFISIILNLILIPKFQTVGASITVLITNALMFVLGIYWAPKILPEWRGKAIKVWTVFGKSLISVMAMSLVIFYLKFRINLFFVIPIGGLVYFIFLFIFRGIKKEDISSIYSSFIKKTT